MSRFANSFRDRADYTETENGARAHRSTGDKVLDLFARVGAMRNASEDEINAMFLAARVQDKELADKIVLYARNIRDGGLGERRVARVLIRTLAFKDPAKIRRNLDTIVGAGRFDDLFILEGTPVENEMFEFLKEQFRKDVTAMGHNGNVSLLGKWLPSINTSSKETRRLARKVVYHFGISERTYRKTLSALRTYIDIVEKRMSAKEFAEINYQAVPSVAMTRYRHAFGVHDFDRFDAYLKSVQKGEAKINASVTYPYELVRPYIGNGYGWHYDDTVDPVLEAQWKALPNYVEGNHNVIVMADISGSMTCDNCRPMAASTSLGVYFAERNTGSYANLVMTFDSTPHMYELNPHATLRSRINEVRKHGGLSTNLDGAFKAIFDLARRAGEAPDALVVISDMEIDRYMTAGTAFNGMLDIVEKWQDTYAEYGLLAPKIIFWNVESRGNRPLARCSNPGVAFCSGSSASTFKELTTLISMTAVEAMVAILNKPQFAWK